MADTGAPWNIPYVAGSDLVADWPTDNQSQAEAIADALDAINDGGIGKNAVTTVKTDTFQSSSTSFVDVTGLSVTITPTSATSRILVMASTSISRFNYRTILTLTDGSNNDLVNPDSPGSRMTGFLVYGDGDDGNNFAVTTFHLLHSPATTSPFTYKVRARTNNGSERVSVNRSDTDTDNSNFARTISTITAIEVAS